jgi:fumarate hydratase class II
MYQYHLWITAVGIVANNDHIHELLHGSLMLYTALNLRIEYDNAAKIAKSPQKNCITLKEAIVSSILLTAEQYNMWKRPEDMLGPNTK